MFGREILGIYLGDQQISYALIRRKLNKWVRQSSSFYLEYQGRNSIEKLGSFLSQLNPKGGRRLCIGLPRSRYFLREIKFPGLSLEEADNAVRMAIGVHAHLPQDTIYFDCYPYEKDGQAHVLLAYAKRSFIDAIVEQVSSAGHYKNLHCICPLGLGTDLFLRSCPDLSFPMISLQEEEDSWVFNLHGRTCWEGSHTLGRGIESGAFDRLLTRLPGHYRAHRELAVLGKLGQVDLDGWSTFDPCSEGGGQLLCGEQGWSPGLSACLPGTSAYPVISLDPRPRKKPLRLRINTFQLLLLGLLAMMVVVTGNKLVKLTGLGREYDRNQVVVKRLEAKLRPLEKKAERLKRLQAVERDMDDFIHQRPPLLEILRELAIRTPLDSWLKYLTLKNNIMKVSAEGGSAVKTIESWRKSPLFSEVRLVSPVTKNREGKERFTVELKLKSGVPLPAKKVDGRAGAR